jgi:pyruvyltransferase
MYWLPHLLIALLGFVSCSADLKPLPVDGLPLYYYKEDPFINFGDFLSHKVVERLVGKPLKICPKHPSEKEPKLLAIGSILWFARDYDVVWGSGLNGKRIKVEEYRFTNLDVHAVRGPLTRSFLQRNFGISCPEIYGDPALLIPYLFPEFTRRPNPSREYIVIAHYLDREQFPKDVAGTIVHATDNWVEIINKILDSKFVISSTLHGIVVAEAFGIPARLLRINEKEPLVKFQDYYFGTGRPHFTYARSIDEALAMGGEPPFECDLEALYNAFPFEHWPNHSFKRLSWSEHAKK